jgi:hypothetical protein
MPVPGEVWMILIYLRLAIIKIKTTVIAHELLHALLLNFK